MIILASFTMSILTCINFSITNLDYYELYEEEEKKGKRYSGIIRGQAKRS